MVNGVKGEPTKVVRAYRKDVAAVGSILRKRGVETRGMTFSERFRLVIDLATKSVGAK